MKRINLLATAVFFAILLLISSFSSAETLRPRNVKTLAKTSVKIMNMKLTSGGTGAIIRSFRTGSHILTNKHVCKLIEQGGVVVQEDRVYSVTHYKKFPHHDLCLVRVATDLKVNLVIADRISKKSELIRVSGHPNLLPHIATKGHLSGHRDIQLMIGLKKCTEEDFKKDPLPCLFLGGMPILKTFESVVVSNLIMPGSSGSSIFNRKGEIVGVIYAGRGRGLSYGFAVPHIHVLYFIQNATRFKWVKVGTKVSDKGIMRRIFSFEKCKNPLLPKKINQFCESIAHSMIWRK